MLCVWMRLGDEIKVILIRDLLVFVIFVGVVIICFRLVLYKKLDKVLFFRFFFKML